jgi:putative membrane protein
MAGSYWNDLYFGWGWFLWFGMLMLIFSSFGNWGYTFSAHRKYGALSVRGASEILNERYVRGEITREQFTSMKADIK